MFSLMLMSNFLDKGETPGVLLLSKRLGTRMFGANRVSQRVGRHRAPPIGTSSRRVAPLSEGRQAAFSRTGIRSRGAPERPPRRGCWADASGPGAEERAVPDYALSRSLKKDGELDNWTPSVPGVYAVFDEEEELQYIGLSRKISASIARHAETVVEKMHAAQVLEMAGASKEDLQSVWKGWIEDHVAKTGNIPAGNKRGEGQWLLNRQPPARAKEEVKLTPGKGADDLLVPIEKLVDSLVKTKKVVAFIKGTRTQPECGFSHQVLALLNQTNVDYETVNVLDEHHNPGLREAIKVYSDWPTIPQVYVNGDFIGGADIITEMSEKGELKSALQA